MNVLLVGAESAGIQLVRRVASSGHHAVGVLAQRDPDAKGPTVWSTAEKLGLRTWPGRLVKDPAFAEVVRDHDVDVILNAHSMYIIHDAILEAAKVGSFNLHPGPLPEYAGMNVVSWAIYNGETEHAVTLHAMTGRIDAGDVIASARFPVTPRDTALTVFRACVTEGIPLALRLLDDAERGTLERHPQDLSRRRYFSSDVPQNGLVEWGRPAAEVVNFVRACDFYPFPSPWGHPTARYDGKDVEIVKAAATGRAAGAAPGTVGEVEGETVHVATGDEWVGVTLVRVGGRAVKAPEVLAGGGVLLDGVAR